MRSAGSLSRRLSQPSHSRSFDLDVGERLVALAAEHDVKLAVNQNGRWAPPFSYLTAAVRSGLIGEVASVDFTLQCDHTLFFPRSIPIREFP